MPIDEIDDAGKGFLAKGADIKKCIDMAKAGDPDFAKLMLVRLQAKIRLIEAIRDALGEAEAYVGGKCAVSACATRYARRPST